MTEAAQQHCTRAWYMRPPVWVLGIVLVALAVFGVVEMSKGPAALSYGEFFDQLDADNIASVTFAGTQIDGVFKHPVAKAAAKAGTPQTNFRSQAPEFGDPALLPELRKQHVSIDVVSSSGWLSWLGRLPWPLVLMVAALLIAGLVKLARGGKTSEGLAVPTHPMMGLITGLFGKKKQDTGHTAGERVPPAAP